jgi:hypothetical protein
VHPSWHAARLPCMQPAAPTPVHSATWMPYHADRRVAQLDEQCLKNNPHIARRVIIVVVCAHHHQARQACEPEQLCKVCCLVKWIVCGNVEG